MVERRLGDADLIGDVLQAHTAEPLMARVLAAV